MQGAPGLSGASDDEGILVGQPADVCALSVLYAPKAVAIKQQAEAILQNKQADLIAVGRQSQINPNIAQHWAHDLGLNRKFEDWTPEFGWWLEKRIRTSEGFATPTGVVKPNT